MNVVEKVEKFEEWLKSKTSLSNRSIGTYLRTIRAFLLFSNGDESIESMNKYIRNYPLARFVFKKYLEFLGRDSEANQLIRVKKARRREGEYTNEQKLLQIPNYIRRKAYRIVALIQALTGARAIEVLTIRKDNVFVEKDYLKIKLITKGEKERYIYIPQPFAPLVYEFIHQSNRTYPFLGEEQNQDLDRAIYNSYISYYRQVKNAARALGLKNFGTHDFRRNFINRLYEKTKDIRLVAKAVGHAKLETSLRYLDVKVSEEEIKKLLMGEE
jgi:integrase/recombinase XerD